jgi:hypothetical protein
MLMAFFMPVASHCFSPLVVSFCRQKSCLTVVLAHPLLLMCFLSCMLCADSVSFSPQRHWTPPSCTAEPRSQQQQQQQFLQPPGPICRAEACLLVLDLPPHISRQELQQALGAEEAWLGPQQQQQQQQLGSRGLGSSNNACCTFKGVL